MRWGIGWQRLSTRIVSALPGRRRRAAIARIAAENVTEPSTRAASDFTDAGVNCGPPWLGALPADEMVGAMGRVENLLVQNFASCCFAQRPTLMSGADFEGLLADSHRLDATSLGPTAVDRAVQRRQEACRLPDRNAYWLHLRASPSELQELVEAVVVPETWFLRDPQAFTALAAMARAQLQANPARPPLRLLSLPCSTGEEPLSMAMAMMDAGIDPSRFRIDGVDVSGRVIELARQGWYGSNSFRGTDLDFRDRHFDGAMALAAACRAGTVDDFSRGNLSLRFHSRPGYLRLHFCRNVLIFDQPSKRKLVVLLRCCTARLHVRRVGNGVCARAA